MKEFNLLENEQIIEEIKPLPNLKKYFYVKLLFPFAPLLFVILLMFFPIFDIFDMPSDMLILFLFTLLFLYFFILIVFVVVLGKASFNKYYYWLTNKRVITKRGVFGYQITSIPYERISDIIISRTFLENLFGFGSLHIQSLAGQSSFQPGRGIGMYSILGSEGQLLAIPNPEETQNKILQLVRTKRKDEGLTI